MRHREVHHVQLALLLAVVVVSAQVPDPSLTLSNERSSIERTYELTKYLEHQLREIKNTYLSYLGPPFSDPDFSPPRPNTTALTLPSAATRLDLWRGLENRARLAQNHRAYSVLLGAVRELAQGTLCPYLQSSLLHFSAGLDGLLGSISGLMTTLGYALPPQYYSLGRSDPHRDSGVNPGLNPEGRQEERGTEREETRRGERGKGERGRRGQRWEGGNKESEEEESLGEERETEGWGGRRRRLLSLREGAGTEGGRSTVEFGVGYLATAVHLYDSHQQPRPRSRAHTELPGPQSVRVNLTELLMDEILLSFYSNDNDNGDHLSRGHGQKIEPRPEQEGHAQDLEPIGRSKARERGSEGGMGREDFPSFTSFPSLHQRRSRSLPSSLYTSTLHPPLSPLSLFYQFGIREGHTLLSDLAPGGTLSQPPLPPPPPSPLLSALSNAPLLHAPSLNDFSRKVESFWLLRELQSWLWRSAKDFNRLKKRLKA